METPCVGGPSGRLKLLRQICHPPAADFAKLFLITCQIVIECQKIHRGGFFFLLRTTLIWNSVPQEQSTVRGLASSCTILQLNIKAHARCSLSLSLNHTITG